MNLFQRQDILLPLFFVTLISLLLFSCKPGEKEQENEQHTTEDSLLQNLTEEQKAELSCLMQEYGICQSGINIGGEDALVAQLGDFIADIIFEQERILVEDSIENQEGYVWATRTVHLQEGRLIFEGNFIDDRGPIDSLLQESTINRIRILSPTYKTPNQLGLGDTFAKLMEVSEGKELGLIHLPDFGYIDVQVGQSHIHFLISDSFITEESLVEGLDQEMIPPGTNIEMIVVM